MFIKTGVKTIPTELFFWNQIHLSTRTVSLNTANAFNSVPWSCINEALIRVNGAYLSEKSVTFPGSSGWGIREV